MMTRAIRRATARKTASGICWSPDRGLLPDGIRSARNIIGCHLSQCAALTELQLPTGRLAQLLVGFNLGVEIGQLTLVVTATLLAAGLMRLRMALPRPLVVDVSSAFLVGLGCFWFVTRSF